nr:reverse transcriptase domain-containing protein [Tanacetum cinerariifolium]
MQTRSSSRLVSNPSSNPTSSTNLNPKCRNRRRSKQRIENLNLEDLSPLVVTMADQRTMAQLLQAPTEGYEDAIVVPAITADNFEHKHGLLTLVQNKKFFGHDKEDPHAHVRYFNKITCTLKFPNVLNTSIKLMLFPFSIKGAARIWLEKEPPRSIFTWDDLVSKFINQFFPPSKTTSLRNEITNFQQRLDESFNQDSFNSAAGGNFLDKMPRECLSIIESKSKVRYSRNKPVISKVSTNASTSGVSPDVAELKDMVKALLLDKKTTDGNNYRDNIQEFVSQAFAVNYNQGNISYRPPMMSNQIRPPGFPPVPNNQNVQRNNQNRFIPNQNQGNNFNQGHVYQPSVFQPPAYQAPAYQAPAPQTQGQNMQNQLTNLTDLITKFVNSNTTSTSSSGTLPRNTIANPKSDLKAITTRSGVSYDGPPIPPLPSSLPKVVEDEPEATKDIVNPTNNVNTEDVQPQAVQSESPVLISKPVTSPISEPAIAPVRDPGKFLIPCDFPGMVECLALAEIGSSINLMPFSVWKRLSLPDLTSTCMTLELSDHLISHPVGVAEDAYVKEVLGFFDTISSGNPTPYYDPIIFATSLTLTLFGNSDFLLEEVDAFLTIEDEPTSSEFHQFYLDPEGDILLLEAFLNDDPSLPPPNQRNYLPEVRKELKIYEAKSDKSLVDEHPAVELKCLPPQLEYAFLEGDDKLPVIIAKDLSVEEKTALITVLQSHNPWVSLVHYVPKKGGFTVVKNEDNELIPTRLVTGWRVCIDYRKLKEATRKDHFPLPFMDQMLERLPGNQYYCFLDGFSGYFQIPINPKDQEKTTFTCPYGTFAYRRMPFGLCNAPGTFQRCMIAIFHDMIKKTMEVFMDDFSVFGNSFQSCLSHLERMLKRFSPANSKAAGLAHSLFLKFIPMAPSSCHNPTGLTSKSMVIVLSTILERTYLSW